MAYQALYRQWRPVDFNAMVGQEAIVATLRNQVASGRIAHAYLFCGSRGTGKTSAAKIMARAVNCEHPDHGNPCGSCESCQRLLKEESLDVMEIDAASNNGVDEIRDLRETVKYPPQNQKYKVYIIDEVHMLSGAAFNALLKTLEEPPAHVIFILATTEPQKLPATILSRCQRFDFGRIPVHQIAARLREAVEGAGATASDMALQMIARAAEGGMRDALSILDMCLGYQSDVTEKLVRNVLGTADRSFLFHFADALRDEDPSTLMQLIDELMRSGRDPIVFAKDVSRHLRALLIAKSCPDDLANLLDLTKEDAAEYIGQAEGMTQTRLMNMLELFMSVETDLRSASSPRMALENAALKACLRTGETDAAALNDRIRSLEKQLAELTQKLNSGAFVSAAPAVEQSKVKKMSVKEAAPAQPKTAPAAGKDAQEAWKAALKILERTSTGLYSILAVAENGKLISGVDDHFVWEVNKDRDVYIVIVKKGIDTIIEALTQATGVPCTFEVKAPGRAKETSQTQAEADAIKELQTVFGAQNVVVQDKL
ncbi:MAG: DNA polymerase III subunit gamma/tau [Clostridia bacterium]|nr:DNA polymerase III subunit gamma/tau [Clostridia bacterium]